MLSNNLRSRRQSGFTLLEILVSIGIAGLILSLVMPLVIYSGKSFAGMANYVEMNANTVGAMDQLTRDIRQAVRLTSFATNQIVLNDSTNGSLTFTFATNATFVRTQGSKTNVLLRGVSSGSFAMYQRTTVSNSYNQFAATNVMDCKLISVQWKCSRSNPGSATNSESDQSARIVIRKN